MSEFIQNILSEFERSLPATRKHLERLPEDKLNWRPAEKSLILGVPVPSTFGPSADESLI